MGKQMIDQLTLVTLKISRLSGIIQSLENEIPLEGKKWQRNMIAHYRGQQANLEKIRDGLAQNNASS